MASLVAVASAARLAVGRRIAPAVAAGRTHPIGAGVLGSLFVHAVLVVAHLAEALAWAFVEGVLPTGERFAGADMLREVFMLFFIAAYGLPPAAVLGLVHGLAAMLLRRNVSQAISYYGRATACQERPWSHEW